MDTAQFWDLVETARGSADDPAGAEAVAEQAAELLAALPPAEIMGAALVIDELLADSYRSPLWAAAYLINGGCSDDGFDYFRGWLIIQGQTVFQAAVADPDGLADNPVVQAAAVDGPEVECEDALYIADVAYETATGEEIPDDVAGASYPELDPAWDFDFDDDAELHRRLPRLAALFGAGG